MLDHVLDIIGQSGYWAYVLIFLIVFLECAALIGFLVPGETMAIFGGFLAAQGVLDIWVVLGLVSAATILGNLAGYELGRRLHRPWILRHGGRFGLRAEHLKRVDHFFHRHGGKAVLLGRMTAFLRAMVPFVAGASHLRYRTFFSYTIAGGIVWSLASVMVGYLAGASWPTIEHWIGRVGAVAVAAVVAALLIYATISRRRFR
jgi:undecaprenyl-diphosphatase